MPKESNIHVALSMLTVLLGTVAVYWPGLDGPFLLDDYLNIVGTYVADFDKDEIIYAVTHNQSGVFGRQVSVLSLLFSGIVHGPEAWGYKYHNLAIHLLNGLLIFWLLLKLLVRISPQTDKIKIIYISGLTAAIWLLHPLMVSTVLYSVQRMAQLSTFFILLGLLFFMVAREESKNGGIKYYLLAYLFFPLCVLLSVLSKENGALIPLYVFILELIIYHFSFSSIAQRNRILCFNVLFVAVPVIAGTLYLFTHMESLADFSVRNFTMGERLLTQLPVVAVYLKMILLPRLSDMGLFHDYFEVTRNFDLVTGFLLLVLILAIYLILHLRFKAPVISFAIAWFIVSHLLESTFFNLELMFEHRNYLASVGPLFGMVYYLFHIPNYPYLKYISVFFLLLVAFQTSMRVNEWSSEEMIYQIAITDHPDSSRAQTQMANFKFRAGDIDGSLQHLAMAQQNDPRDYGAVLHEIVHRCGSGSDMAPLLEKASLRAQSYPVSVYSLNVLDNLLLFLSENRCPEMDYERLLSIIAIAKQQPGNQKYEMYMGFLEKIEGQIYLLTGDYGKGIGSSLSAYEKTGMIRVLAFLVENLLQLNFLEDAEYILSLMNEANIKSRGTETALIKPLQDKLEKAKAAAAIETESVLGNDDLGPEIRRED